MNHMEDKSIILTKHIKVLDDYLSLIGLVVKRLNKSSTLMLQLYESPDINVSTKLELSPVKEEESKLNPADYTDGIPGDDIGTILDTDVKTEIDYDLENLCAQEFDMLSDEDSDEPALKPKRHGPNRKRKPKPKKLKTEGPKLSKVRLCVDCGFKSEDRRRFWEHKKKHEEPQLRKYVCPYCNQELELFQYYQLVLHKKKCEMRPIINKEFECYNCLQKFPTEAKMLYHRHVCLGNERKPQKVYKYTCDYENCDFVHTRKLQLQNHKNEVHLNLPKIRFPCEICGKDFIRKSDLNNHVKRTHTNPDYKPFVCNICGKGFHKKKLLENHEKIHSDVLSFICDYCSKGFKQNAVLYRHKLNCSYRPK